MTNDEAKFLLTGYRPNGRDAGDAKFAAALKQAQQDPTVGAWFARSQRHDAAIAAKLTAIAPPPGLREAILAGAKASEAPVSSGLRRSWSIAIAIAAAVLVAAAWQWQNGKTARQIDQLADGAIQDVVHGQHGSHGGPAGALVEWLSASTTRIASAAMPVDFEQLRSTGCRSLTIGGRELIEVCFTRGGGEYHVYIAPKRGSTRTGSPTRILARASGAAAVWSDDRFDYVLAKRGSSADFSKLL